MDASNEFSNANFITNSQESIEQAQHDNFESSKMIIDERFEESSEWPELPDEIIIKIFSYLSSVEKLDICRLTCKKWFRLGSDQKIWKNLLFKLFPHSIFFKEELAKYLLFDLRVKEDEEVEKETLTYYDCRYFISHLSQQCPFSNEGTPIEKTQTILEIPKGLTLEHVYNHIQHLNLHRNEQCLDFINRDIIEKFGKNKIEETHCVIITNSVLEKSVNIEFDKIETLLKKEHPHYEVPDLLSATILNIARFVKFGIRSFEKGTYCKEANENGRTGVAHHFEVLKKPIGFIVFYPFEKFLTGIAPLRKIGKRKEVIA